MTPAKRLMDLSLAIPLLALFAVPVGVLSLLIWAVDGRPLFYVSERMRRPGIPFRMWKLRTMTVAAGGQAAFGGHLSGRVTRLGRWLRRLRLDEVPQLWSVVRGDMSLVGPRPPLRCYVERFPDIYAQVLRDRPGITGLASLRFHRHEEHLLAACRTAAETDQVYARRCIPRKARIDLIYQRRRSLRLDVRLLVATAILPLQRLAGQRQG